MNTLGLILLESAVHATVFAIGGALVYLALRRLSPAAGALTAALCLIVTVLVSLVTAAPWRGFWTLDLGRHDRPAAVLPAEARVAVSLPAARAEIFGQGAPESSFETAPRSPSDGPQLGSGVGRLLDDFAAEFRDDAAPQSPERWGWPAWLALGFLVALAAGLIRLGLGILAVRRMRAESLAIADVVLQDEIQLIRAELSCTRQVEARATGEVATPATIGWRRPIILLPFDWRDWDPADRHAVLAHELAHVRRSDYLTSLVAQLSLALHFYHPLAHWLSARLRLEQELAADDWGARLSGGKPSYLASLARLALYRDTPSTIWPARAFLPSRGTFLRRIDMLRKTERLYPAALSLRTRGLIVGVIVALGVAVAGLRVSAVSASSPFQETTQRIDPDRQTGPERKTVLDQPAAGNQGFDLSFLPADTRILFVIRPGPLFKRDEFNSLLSSLQRGAVPATIAVPVEAIDQVAIFWEGFAEPPGQRGRLSDFLPRPTGFVVHTKTPQDWQASRNHILGPHQSFLVDGQTCFRATSQNSPSRSTYSPNDRTLVVAREDLIRELVVDRKSSATARAWDQVFSKVSKGHAVFAIDSRWLRRRLGQGFSRTSARSAFDPAPTLDSIAPLFEKTRAYAVSFQAAPAIGIDLIAEAATEADTKQVVDTLRAVVVLGRNSLQGIGENSRHRPNESRVRPLLPVFDSLLESAQIDSSGSLIHMQAKSSIELGEALKALAPVVASASQSARSSVSANHLKQLGLAIMNYENANGHLPSPVMYGGAQKAVPHSWRVAILPYVGEESLYRQYNFDESWDGANNRKLLDMMPAIFGVPGVDGAPVSQKSTAYFVFTGDATAFGGPTAPGGRYVNRTALEITDGVAYTMLAVERRADVPWTKPEDIPFDPQATVPELGGFMPDSFHALFADGSVRAIKNSINPVTLKALITRAAGELIDSSSY